MAGYELIRDTLPAWATLLHERAGGNLEVAAKPPMRSGTPGQSFDLTITVNNGLVTVKETTPGTSLPKGCPERHINHDGSFCIGLNAGRKVGSAEAASKWWHLLGEFLVCQQVATKFRRWPPEYDLSHGDAAGFQIEMEEIGKKLGWLDEITGALSFGAGWLSEELPRIRKGSGMLVNQRAPCPRRCLKRKHPVLRRNCPHRAEIFRLVDLETKRRKAEEDFIDSFRKAGFTCCKTMDGCPFNNSAEVA